MNKYQFKNKPIECSEWNEGYLDGVHYCAEHDSSYLEEARFKTPAYNEGFATAWELYRFS